MDQGIPGVVEISVWLQGIIIMPKFGVVLFPGHCAATHCFLNSSSYYRMISHSHEHESRATIQDRGRRAAAIEDTSCASLIGRCCNWGAFAPFLVTHDWLWSCSLLQFRFLSSSREHYQIGNLSVRAVINQYVELSSGQYNPARGWLEQCYQNGGEWLPAAIAASYFVPT